MCDYREVLGVVVVQCVDSHWQHQEQETLAVTPPHTAQGKTRHTHTTPGLVGWRGFFTLHTQIGTENWEYEREEYLPRLLLLLMNLKIDDKEERNTQRM